MKRTGSDPTDAAQRWPLIQYISIRRLLAQQYLRVARQGGQGLYFENDPVM